MPRRGLTSSYFTIAGIGVTCPAVREAQPFSLEVVSERSAATDAPIIMSKLKTKLRLAKAARRQSGSEDPFVGYTPSKHSREGGLNDEYRRKVNRETGSNLKRPVTGKVKPGSEAAKRRKSFCARMGGVKGPTSKDGKLTPKGAALRRWKC